MISRLYQMCLFIAMVCIFITCKGQRTASENKIDRSARVGGDCEAGYCELMYAGMPDEINSTDTSAGWHEQGQKLIVTGTCYHLDGNTPAPDVVLYYHHTDNNGFYSPRNDRPGNQGRHGHIRGWIRTDKNGKYKLYTIRPAPYPDRNEPAHIHWLIKEPDVRNEYWTDDLLFEDDSLLHAHIDRRKPGKRAGNGIVKVTLKESVQLAERNFILGMNIPNYYKENK